MIFDSPYRISDLIRGLKSESNRIVLRDEETIYFPSNFMYLYSLKKKATDYTDFTESILLFDGHGTAAGAPPQLRRRLAPDQTYFPLGFLILEICGIRGVFIF
jgi:hypothetical protein